MMPNGLPGADTQQQVAASRRMLRAGQRQRWAPQATIRFNSLSL